MDVSLAFDLMIIFAGALVGGLVAQKLSQPIIVGYVLAGVTIGSYVLGITSAGNTAKTLSEIGIALLMFSLGLELVFKKFLRVARFSLIIGAGEIFFTTLLSIIFYRFFQVDFFTSLVLGLLFSLSSTAVVIKILGDRGELDTTTGEITLGVLLVQDLAVLPMIIILPVIGKILTTRLDWPIVFLYLALVIIKTIIFLLAAFLLGKIIIPKIIAGVAKRESRELLLLSVVSICLITAFGTYALGLSFALGAFLAGLIISETSQNHAVFSEIRPLRDIFVIVFFVSLGLLINPSFLFQNLGLVLATTAFVVFLKLSVVFLTGIALGFHTRTAFFTAVSLVQVGEFAFVLANLLFFQGLLQEFFYQLILTTAMISILFTPYFIIQANEIYDRFLSGKALRWLNKRKETVFGNDDKKNKIIIVGFGRVGGVVGKIFRKRNLSYTVIDYNQTLVSQLKEKAIDVIYGDPADKLILEKAGISGARLLIIALPDFLSSQIVFLNARKINPAIKIFCRCHNAEDAKKLLAEGADVVIQPEHEGAVSLAEATLKLFSVKH